MRLLIIIALLLVAWIAAASIVGCKAYGWANLDVGVASAGVTCPVYRVNILLSNREVYRMVPVGKVDKQL